MSKEQYNMNNDEKIYKWVEPFVTRQELIQTLVKGLDRALTHQEARILNWICDGDCETRGVILDLFTELVQRQDGGK